MNPKERIDYLVDFLNRASYSYYVLNVSEITDQEFDSSLRELTTLEEKYPEFVREDSPTKKVNGTASRLLKKVLHESPMLSLGNIFNETELREFDAKIKKAGVNPEYVCELKIDGLSGSFVYEKGLLKRSATRGDGLVGEDITLNAMTIENLPKKLTKDIDIEVRGEIYMAKEVLERLNKLRREQGENELQNTRNAASGSIRQLNSEITKERALATFIYHLPMATDFNILTHYETLAFMKKLGFTVNSDNRLVKNVDEVWQFIEYWTKNRDELPYDIDGIVIKLNSFNDQEKLGWTMHHPKWAVAYKFPSNLVMTELEDVFWTVGRTGRVTPNAVLSPTLIMGSTVRKATLHNYEFIKAKNLLKKDTVLVHKAGDVIPEVVGSVVERRTGKEKPIHEINVCPICNSKLIKPSTLIGLFCPNDDCPAREIEKLIHFCSRKAMNIESLGEQIIEEFYNLRLVNKVSDFYNLKNKKEELINLEGFGTVSIEKMLNNIEISKTLSLEHLLFGLGIKGIGSKNATILAKSFNNLETLENVKYEELVNIKDIGPILATNVIAYFQNKASLTLIKQLKEAGLNQNYITKKEKKNVNFYNKQFVLTGTLTAFKREDLKSLIESFGGVTMDAVSSKTDVLIVGQNVGSKLAKAQALKIEVWDEAELKRRIKED